jgi:D-3-phosphoglycerate dehydrogenase
LRAVFVDANDALSAVMGRLLRPDDLPVTINRQPAITPAELPDVLGDADIAIIDHTHLPIEIARQCAGLRHVVFLGTGPQSYMDPARLDADLGIRVHVIKGYGDTAVAECAFALMWASAKGLAGMDRAMRAGNWMRTEAMQLTGKTLGLVGFGGIGREMARLSLGVGMRVVTWNRSAVTHPGVAFMELDTLLGAADVVSLHLALNEETRGILSAGRIARMKPGVILINTARGALVDEAAMIAALRSGQIGHAGLDVYATEPMPAGHELTTLANVTLSAHSGFRTPEANDNLICAALDHCRRIAGEAR